MVSKFTPIQQERPIDLTTRYRDRSRALAMRPSLIGAQNRAQTDVISVAGGLRLLMGVRKLQAASPHVLSPSSIYIHIFGRGFHLAKCFGQNDTTNHRSITV